MAEIPITAEQVMEVVERSPQLVGARDKAGWLALFTDDAVVEDPVGTRPHRRGQGRRGPEDELGRFYEVFIAPNRVRFEVRGDVVVPPFAFRDVLIHTELPNGHRVEVPAHILYEVCLEGGAPKLRRLQAYWSLGAMPRLALAGGFKGLAAVNRQTFRMLRVQRLGGMLGYVRGFRTLGRRAPRLLHAFADAVSAQDPSALEALFRGGAPCIEVAPAEPMTPSAFLSELGDGAALTVRDLRVAGRAVSFAFELDGQAGQRHGLGVVDLQRRPARITRVRLFAPA